MTWKELKEICNSLMEEQLNKNVVLWREDEAISKIECDRLSEDHYIGEGEDSCYPESDATEPIESLTKVYSAGDAVLWEKFFE